MATRPIPDYALACVKAAYDAGARWVVLCDTNGGTLPHEVYEITKAVIAAASPATIWASTPMTTPAMPWRARWPRSTQAHVRCKAR